MNKLGAVAIVIGLTVALYLIVLVVMPVITDIISTANATVTAQSNWADYPGTQGALIAVPWIMWFIPGTISLIVIVIILKRT